RSRRVTSRRRSRGESRRACSRSFSTALMAVLAQLGFYPREGRFPTFSGRLATASARHSRVFGGPPSNGRRTVKCRNRSRHRHIELSAFCYRRRRTLVPQGPRKLAK